MIQRSPECIAAVLNELKQRDDLAFAGDIACEIQEYSYNEATLHFSAREKSTGRPLIIKVGADERELYWTAQLARIAPDILPELLAMGHLTQGNFMVFERIEYNALGPLWQGREFDLLLQAAVRFYRAAQEAEPLHLSTRSFHDVLHWLEQGSKLAPPGDWQSVIHHAEEDYSWLKQECPLEVCHGDLHLRNVVSRNPPPHGPALLIDIGPIRDFWVFEAAYTEILTCGNQARKGIGNIVPRMNEFRREAGLRTLTPFVLEKATRMALAWFAIKMWNPAGCSSPDYENAMSGYINAGAVGTGVRSSGQCTKL